MAGGRYNRGRRRAEPVARGALSEDTVADGTVKSVVFHNAENGYTVLHVTAPARNAFSRGEEITVVGKCAAVWEGEEIHAEGHWVDDAEIGRAHV